MLRLRVPMRLPLALLLAAGCAAGGMKQEALDRWVGRPAAALEKEWGGPTREARDGELRVLVYEEIERYRTDGTGTFESGGSVGGAYMHPHTAAQALFRAPTVYVRSYLFWVDAAGTIVHSTVRQP